MGYGKPSWVYEQEKTAVSDSAHQTESKLVHYRNIIKKLLDKKKLSEEDNSFLKEQGLL